MKVRLLIYQQQTRNDMCVCVCDTDDTGISKASDFDRDSTASDSADDFMVECNVHTSIDLICFFHNAKSACIRTQVNRDSLASFNDITHHDACMCAHHVCARVCVCVCIQNPVEARNFGRTSTTEVPLTGNKKVS